MSSRGVGGSLPALDAPEVKHGRTRAGLSAGPSLGSQKRGAKVGAAGLWSRGGVHPAEAVHPFLPHRRKSECVGWGKSSSHPERLSSWFPSLKLGKAGLGPPSDLQGPMVWGLVILKVDVAVLLKAILKQPFVSPAVLRSQATQPSAWRCWAGQGPGY